MNAKVRGQTCE